MKRAIISTAIALTLTACGGNGTGGERNGEQVSKSDRGTSASAAHSPENRPAPAPPEDMAYFLDRGERGPTLSYGEPRTDNIALSLRCPAGGMGKTVLVYFNRPADVVAQRPDRLTLLAGDARQELDIETSATQLGVTVEAQSSPDSAPLRAFRDGERLSVIYGDETITIPAKSENIRRFFNACLA